MPISFDESGVGMKKGDILHGLKNLDGKHRIIFLSEHDSYSFVGAMLTHDGRNILMAKEHFKDVDNNGTPYAFCFDTTYLVDNRLFKKLEWAPFEKVGELTEVGIQFVESTIADTHPMFWEEARRR